MIGFCRSGTTWLRYVLSEHPEVLLMNEMRIYDRPSLSAFMGLRNHRTQLWVSEDHKRRLMARGPRTTEAVEAIVFDDPGLKVIGDKTATAFEHDSWDKDWYALREQLYPADRIYIHRHPESVFGSLADNARRPGSPTQLAERHAAVHEYGMDMADLRISYERMVDDPATVGRAIDGFVGLDGCDYAEVIRSATTKVS